MRRFVLLMVCLSPIVVGNVAVVQVAAEQQSTEPVASGVIYGMVIDQNGQPAKELGLTAYPLGVALGAMLPGTRTDQNGKFRFADIPWWGRYTVIADDCLQGYFQFVTWPNPSAMSEVTLSPEHPEAEFNFRLPPQAGFLEIHLANRRTGEAIREIRVTAFLANHPRQSVNAYPCVSYRVSLTHVILIPPDKNLLLHVTARGFHEWAKSVGNGMPIRVPSGSRLELNAALEPR